MDTAIIVSIISGIFTLAGTIISVVVGFSKASQKAAIQQAVTDTKLEALTEEVRKHNNFAERLPVLEEQIKVANHRIADLEAKSK
jgi:TolA-binding protein